MNDTGCFQVGGSLERGHPSYVERPADEQLLHCLCRGEIPLVLAPRQTGKSSLMVNALGKLEDMGIRWAIVDLQPLGSHRELEDWLGDVINQIERTLGLAADTLEWWDKHRRLGPTQRFMAFVEDVILGLIDEPVVIFFDEIDSVLPLPFADDFFTTLRALANARASNSTLKRFTFALLGVATPSEFIKNRSRTPFNIGRGIQLTDFDPDHAAPIRRILGPSSDPLVDRIFYWTGGQPLMVQALADKMHLLPESGRTIQALDDAVRETYLKVRIGKETHLNFIRDYLLDRTHQPRKTLTIYRTIIDGGTVQHDERSPVHARLLLSGVVRLENGLLVPRNRIYQQVFDRQWVGENIPRDRARMIAYVSSVAMGLVLLWFFLIKPLWFPTFTKAQQHGWFDTDIHYVTEDHLTLPLTMALEKPRRMTLNGEPFSPPGKGEKATTSQQILIPLKDLKIGPNRFQVRFYGDLWEENFETSLTIVYFPMSHWQLPHGLEMVDVPAGCFDMGCGEWTDSCNSAEKPVHGVCLSDFQVGRFEVTQKQWISLMGYNPSYFKNEDRLPVENVSWEDAREFIRRINRMTGRQYKLPSEAQWEYAARSGGRPEKYAGGNDLDSLGWYTKNSQDKSHPIGGKSPNGLGLHDMSGNVWEWCHDWYASDYYANSPEADPTGPLEGTVRVLRGGSWGRYAVVCRTVIRYWDDPGVRFGSIGFRLVCLPGQPGEPGK
ncbi:hypothetical protein DSCO28_52260 [Desulfosarcina ovata subsp. sediminis]|uniref:Sulfatase-modifying factor enzyme-like domain-containing protein n=1 Tax=Desulfosarcina ovata subsp. sediminis TaxID=885957 RepID=A0A5K7ZX28_9BACT|nr:SUMF1/EgtB/PvdO family nonheme iron enzyme [Desulfosarcina ovata]BBO84660.1 hypothetical protein DSCO28_52260 [Desulfosarcina ovata subsp. sediminis]